MGVAERLVFLPQHLIQLALCFYGIQHSYIAITNLLKYEATTKKLAKWSSEVERQLWMTRKTQAIGALSVVSSLVVATLLIVCPTKLPAWFRYPAPLALCLLIRGAIAYIKSFWAPYKDSRTGKDVSATPRVPVPGLEDYNVAERKTEDLLVVLNWLSNSWMVTALSGGLTAYGFV